MAASPLRGGQAGAAERTGVGVAGDRVGRSRRVGQAWAAVAASGAGGGGAKTRAVVDAVAASVDPAVGSFEVALLETESFGCATFLVYVT